MSTKIIDGKALATRLRAKIAGEITRLSDDGHPPPGLAVVLVGSDPASEVYVRSKGKMAREVGMKSIEIRLDANTSQDALLAEVEKLNHDPDIHGILCQLPLPDHIDEASILGAIAPKKDVDGFHIINAGLLATGQNAMVPCTPLGCLLLLRSVLGDLSGKRAVVIGRSNIVGKPMAALLLGANCTITIAHSRTKDMPSLCREADILVVAVGRAEFVKGEWIKPGAAVIDVGINRIMEGEKPRLVGDVEFESARNVAGAITPVPGGVGPMTIACLLANTLTAYCRIRGIGEPDILEL